tara:strand:+ start:27 stop:683 length:657 start_codon:yes stop_codon:yes gene_type:complete
MSNLDKIAIKNLELLNNLTDNIEEYQLVINGHVISQSDDENYEGIFNLQELEYPIFFSFQQVFNSIRYSNLYKIEGYKTNDLINLMDSSIDRIVTILEKTEDDPYNESLCEIVDEIDEKYIILNERNLTCSFWKIYETFNDYLDSFSEALIECNRYLYISSHYSRIELEEVNNEEGVNNETDEINPNLIYSEGEEEEEELEELEEEEEEEEEFFKKVN